MKQWNRSTKYHNEFKSKTHGHKLVDDNTPQEESSNDRKKIGVIALSSMAVLTFGSAFTAAAEPNASSASQKSELESHLDSLPEDERQDFINTKLPASTSEETAEQQPADADARQTQREANATGQEVTAQSSGCWTAKTTTKGKAAAGNVLYTNYTTGGWCSNGTKVTSARVVSAGGETSTPGWKYGGVIAQNSGVIGNKAKVYSQSKFTLGASGVDVQEPTPCAKITGSANGTYSGSQGCGL